MNDEQPEQDGESIEEILGALCALCQAGETVLDEINNGDDDFSVRAFEAAITAGQSAIMRARVTPKAVAKEGE